MLSLPFTLLSLVLFIDSYVEEFFKMFNKYYSEAVETDFEELSLQEQIKYVKHLYKVREEEREGEREGGNSFLIFRKCWVDGLSLSTMILM